MDIKRMTTGLELSVSTMAREESELKVIFYVAPVGGVFGGL